jgi:hypothetical protein
MGVSKWLMKKGAIGGTTRSMIKAYHIQKESDPNISDSEIFRAITMRRYSIIGNNIDPVFVGTAAQPKTLREYIKCMVIYEKLPYSIDSADIIREVIDEICDEEKS